MVRVALDRGRGARLARFIRRGDNTSRRYGAAARWEGRHRYLPMGELAKTLKHLAAAGPRDFYEGEIARSLVGELRAAGSSIGLRISPSIARAWCRRWNSTIVASPLPAARTHRRPYLKHVMGELAGRQSQRQAPGDGDYLAYARSCASPMRNALGGDGEEGPAGDAGELHQPSERGGSRRHDGGVDPDAAVALRLERPAAFHRHHDE